jgi:3',5'-cyclic AMP phosphodiesterase CpdA
MSTDQVTSLILRFRDLVTPRGDTIAFHREIIVKREEVWWGWWKKSGETVPDEVFRSLVDTIRTAGPIQIYLMDSGHAQLFAATCPEIRWDANHDFLISSDSTATPDYYREQSYQAWFRFTNISDPLDPELLHTFSYVRVDDFFEERPSRYGAFYGKRIYSLGELIQQNRTIWFVRAARPSDPVHQVSFFNASLLEPADFDRSYQQTPSANLLWVSDLHYSATGHHGFALEPTTASLASVGSAIERAFQDHGIADVGGVIVSGDITWKAEPEEYHQARHFFEWTRRWTKVGNSAFVTCPGNHDLSFSADAADKTAKVDVDMAPETARSAYVDFYRELFFKAPNRFLSSGRKFLLGDTVAVDIACLNSSLLDQQKDLFQGHGFLGDDQLRDAAAQLGWSSGAAGPRAFRIVVVHHHVMPVTFREQPQTGRIYSVALDAEALMRWCIEHRVNLILHGHMHQPFCAKVSRPVNPLQPLGAWHALHVLGLGSSGVARNDVGEVGKNIFAVLHFGDTGVEVRLFSIAADSPSAPHWNLTIPYRAS